MIVIVPVKAADEDVRINDRHATPRGNLGNTRMVPRGAVVSDQPK
jgi:hypothetical protein